MAGELSETALGTPPGANPAWSGYPPACEAVGSAAHARMLALPFSADRLARR